MVVSRAGGLVSSGLVRGFTRLAIGPVPDMTQSGIVTDILLCMRIIVVESSFETGKWRDQRQLVI